MKDTEFHTHHTFTRCHKCAEQENENTHSCHQHGVIRPDNEECKDFKDSTHSGHIHDETNVFEKEVESTTHD